MTIDVEKGKDEASPFALILDLEGAEKARAGALAAEARRKGYSVVTFDLRATGKLAWKSDKVHNAHDHNTAEWGIWIGRPLLGQWVSDVSVVIDQLWRDEKDETRKIVLLGEGPAGLVALTAGAIDERISGVASVGALASYVTDVPYKNQRLGVIPPAIFSQFGDIGDVARLVPPRRLVIAGGVSGGGRSLTIEELREAYAPALRTSSALNSSNALTIIEKAEPSDVFKPLE